MIFEIGKTYRHNSGKIMTIIGRLKTHIYGECLIGECDTGELIPVGESEDNAVNWHESITGHWVKEETIYGWDGKSYQCSACGRSIHLDTKMEDLRDYPYCHCGAKMEGVSTMNIEDDININYPIGPKNPQSESSTQHVSNSYVLKQNAYTDFLNDIERVAEKHGWNIGIADNQSEDSNFARVEITFIPAGGADALNRKFGVDS